ANMQSDTLRGRRGVIYERALAVRAADWQLVLDKPSLLPTPHTFANIVPAPGAHVLGVAYEMTLAELERVELTEGVGFGNYRRHEIAIAPLGEIAAGPTTAFTLVSERRAPAPTPSTRYMGLLVDGATEHGLPAAYVDALRAIPALDETPETQAQ